MENGLDINTREKIGRKSKDNKTRARSTGAWARPILLEDAVLDKQINTQKLEPLQTPFEYKVNMTS